VCSPRDVRQRTGRHERDLLLAQQAVHHLDRVLLHHVDSRLPEQRPVEPRLAVHVARDPWRTHERAVAAGGDRDVADAGDRAHAPRVTFSSVWLPATVVMASRSTAGSAAVSMIAIARRAPDRSPERLGCPSDRHTSSRRPTPSKKGLFRGFPTVAWLDAGHPSLGGDRLMSDRSALVLGGTGMLAGCVTTLLEQGWQVVLPSRRPPDARRYDTGAGQMARRALRPPGHTTTRTADRGANWIAADWTRPLELAVQVNEVLERPAALLVAWVHSSYRLPVMLAVAPFLAPHAPVVEVLGISEIDSVRGLRDPVMEHHPTQQVVLGYVKHHGTTRWLTHQEASAGLMEAVQRALDGRPSSVHQVGEVNRWLQSR
jgi:hypothetical protein